MVRQDRSDRRGGGHKRGKRDDYHHGPKSPRTNKAPVDENSPVIAVFRTFQTELDAVHDKHERLVKLSRDVTIDSKRVIFLLHRISREEKKQSILDEADTKIAHVKQRLCQIAQELQGEDPYKYLRAFSPGTQEFIEALLFHHYIKNKQLLGHKDLEQQLSFEIIKESKDSKGPEVVTGQGEGKEQEKEDQEKKPEEKSEETSLETSKDPEKDSQATEQTKSDDADEAVPEKIIIDLHIPPNEYMLGMADFTGELMRMCINSVGSGDRDTPFQLVSFMREIYDGFQLLGNTPNREVVRKLYTMRQSLKKVENACYTLHVRGSEIPQHMLLDVITSVEKGERGFGDGEDEH